ncbi:MAG: hypothetical protein K2X73_01345 [Sphingomonas sp.]|jgi:hypothetical protein|uniref:hypothetical protein n=1 Tax=Sphingomonas sp. TaxID=28214 RepID=UPI0025ED99B4|nr:hypothetical protein [Sphingomonas sp.]MBX9880595.1 hypothetical protein [Sphingomonas sp.]
MSLVGRIQCLFGVHHRSQGRAKPDDARGTYVSVCRHCGVPMERQNRRWVRIKG